jgi:hypothetical protein
MLVERNGQYRTPCVGRSAFHSLHPLLHMALPEIQHSKAIRQTQKKEDARRSKSRLWNHYDRLHALGRQFPGN